MKYRRLCSCIIIAAITIFIINRSEFLLGGVVDRGDSYDAIKAFRSLNQNSVEVVGLGSSHMWAAFESDYFTDTYNLSAYNYSNNWQRSDTTLLFLKDILTNQNPKYVIIETYMIGGSNKIKEVNGEILYTRALPLNKAKIGYLYNRFEEDLSCYLQYFIPFIIVHDNWVSINSGNFDVTSQVDKWMNRRGHYHVESVYEVTIPDYTAFEQKQFKQETVDELDEIVKLCRVRDINLIFITTPMDEKYAYFDALEGYAKDNGCDYINFFELSDEIGIDGKTDFYDGSHLNVNGARKVTKYLGEYIKKNYGS